VKHDVGAVNIDVIEGNCTVTVFMGRPATVVRAALLVDALDAVDTPATRPLDVMLGIELVVMNVEKTEPDKN
jgi:hypothetical protein